MLRSCCSRRGIRRGAGADIFRPQEQKPRPQRRQDNDLWIDQVPVANLRMSEIKDQWINSQEKQIWKHGLAGLPERLAETHGHQQRLGERQEYSAGVMDLKI